MSLTTSGETGAGVQPEEVQLTMSLSEAQDLRTVLPWLLHALAERPTRPRLMERRRMAREALERLQSALSEFSQLDSSE